MKKRTIKGWVVGKRRYQPYFGVTKRLAWALACDSFDNEDATWLKGYGFRCYRATLTIEEPNE